MKENTFSGEFLFELADTMPVGSVLYQEHLKLTDKSHIALFAKYLMPLWYSSISAEHEAVRRAAGIFDCTHMGVLEVAGANAVGFLNSVTTGEFNELEVGTAQYCYVLDAVGNVLDDIIAYRRAEDKFMLVVNALNTPKIKAYFEALKSDRVGIDVDQPDRKLEHKPITRDMKMSDGTGRCRVDIALQGPRSIDVLSALTEEQLQQRIASLRPFHFIEEHIQGIECLISRTGYTGARIGFELFVHPEKAPRLWELILQAGKPLGLMPCGLGARDSLRIEAGLPLYGHELGGKFNISPFEAGYGWAVKLQKEFFIGKAAMVQTAKTYNMKVARVKLPGKKGVRPVRQNDGVLNENGECIGWVSSCAKAGKNQFALIYVDRKTAKENDTVGVYYVARSRSRTQLGRKQNVEKGQDLDADIVGTVVSRFAEF